MSHRTVALFCSLALLALPAAAAGADDDKADFTRTGVYLELGGQAMLPVYRHQSSGSASGGVTARAGWRAARPFALELHYEWNEDVADHAVNLITVDGKVLVYTEGAIQPFVRVGVGAIFGHLDDRGGLSSSFVARFGVGTDYWLTDNVAASIFGDFVLPMGHFHYLNTFSVGAAARYTF